MTDDLAEILLAQVMGWGVDEVSEERPYLQSFAYYKYDEYQQFAPGRRFVESLALWLQQFETQRERTVAYEFVKQRLMFVSSQEMQHLVAMAYPDLIRHMLIKRASKQMHVPEYRLTGITASTEFRVLQRQCLFLGLSDGAHTGAFRRANRGEVTHEQVSQTYELSPYRAQKMLDALRKDLATILGREPTKEEARFKMLFLLDDFSGSGFTYLREEQEAGFGGKMASIHEDASTLDSPLAKLLKLDEAEVFLTIYISTQQALQNLSQLLPRLWEAGHPEPRVLAVHTLSDQARLSSGRDEAFLTLCQDVRYYDPAVQDSSTDKGGADVRLGFRDGALPLALFHNTPNNSVALLWSYEDTKVRGLFPRVSRHRDVK